MGLYGGLLGWQPDDERMVDYRDWVEKAGTDFYASLPLVKKFLENVVWNP